MPLAVRYVHPKNVCEAPLVDPSSGTISLQALNSHSISGVIRQLSSLARHAESIMGDIADILASYYVRTATLEERSKRLMAEILPALDPDQEVLEGFEILHPSSQFRSTRRTDQQLLTKQQPATGLAEQYESANKIPALQLFTPLREDGKNAMLFFSDCEFFFEHWRVNMRKKMMRRKTAADLLSPTPGDDAEKRANGVIRSHKTRKESKTSATGLRRSASLKRSFNKRSGSLHSSNLSLQEVGKLKKSPLAYQSFRAPSDPPLRFRRNLSRSFRYSFRKKSQHVAKLGNLTRATAAAFEGQDIPLSMPDVTADESETQLRVPEDKSKSSLIRRSFSFRTSRDRRSRSRSPNPPIPSISIFNGLPMHMLEMAKEKQETSNLATLSKRHLENLELGVTDFDTCLSLNDAKKNSSTFKVPEIIRSRPVSPFLFASQQQQQQQKPARREPPPPPKVLPKPVMPWSDKVLPRERGRAATVSGAGGSEMRQVAVRMRRHLSAAMNQPVTPPTVRPTSSQSSLPVFPPSPAFQRSESPVLFSNSPPALTRVRSGSGSVNGNGGSRGKPRRPAPPKPHRTYSLSKPEGSSGGTTPSPTPSSASIPPPPPPVRCDSISSATTTKTPAASGLYNTPHSGEVLAAANFEPVNPNASLGLGRTRLSWREDSIPGRPHSEALNMQSPIESLPGVRTAQSPDASAGAELQTTPPPSRYSLVSAGALTTAFHYLSVLQSTQSPEQAGFPGAQSVSPSLISGMQPTPSPEYSQPLDQKTGTPPFTSGPQMTSAFSPPRTSAGQIFQAAGFYPTQQTPNNSLSQIQTGVGMIPGDVPPSELSSVVQRQRSLILSPPPPPAASFMRQLSGQLPKPMLRNDSLYISPRKQSIITLAIPAGISESAEEDTNKRSSQILKAGGVGDGDVDITRGRSNLLSAIQKGIHLRQVQRQGTEEDDDKTDPWDVAAILERRLAIMDSETEDESSEEGTDDSDWDL